MVKVFFSKQAAKQVEKLPKARKVDLTFLIEEIERLGPIRGTWKNYSKLTHNRHHCHIGGRHPTYVVIWLEESDGSVTITYVGIHEKAGY